MVNLDDPVRSDGACRVRHSAATGRAPGSEVVVDVTAMMGGFEIRVPESWNVVVELIPFMGGYEDKTRHPTDPSAPRLRVRGFVMMGGVEIKN